MDDKTDPTTLAAAVKLIDQHVPNPSAGLPDDVFYLISRMTPLVNVDLLIKDESGRTLLTWRNDPYCGQGWHIPGGIIRFRETAEERLRKVVQTEIGLPVQINYEPIQVRQCIHTKRPERSHFISMLYRCFLSEEAVLDNGGRDRHEVGFMQWHEECPPDLLQFHEMYRPFLTRNLND